VGIRVRDDVVARLRATPQRFALRVHAPDELPAALSATRLARVDLLGLSGRGRRPGGDTGRDPSVTNRADVSQVVAAPGGPMLLVQHLEAADEDLVRIPRLLEARLTEAGVGNAVIEVPTLGGELDGLDTTPGAVVLRLFPPPEGSATAIPADWLDVAVEWVVGDLALDEPVATRILSVEHQLPARDAAAMLHECGLARAWCDLVNGDLDDRIRTASVTYGRMPHLALAAGGPGVDGPGLLARFALLQDVARELAADLAYAALDFEPTFEGLAVGLPVDGWRARGGASPNRVAASIVDEVVPDAYPWQVLGPGHLDRLAASEEPVDLPFEHLGDGRVELSLGDPVEWLPRSSRRIDAQEDAIAWVLPLLVEPDEADELAAARPLLPPAAPAQARSTEPSRSPFEKRPPVVEPPPEGAPDLHDIYLRATPSTRRSTRLTPLELAAWFGRESHSDHPASVSPALATFVRWWASGLDDESRQRLKPIVPRLVGTAPDEDDEVERTRKWLAVDWLVRVQSVAWLRLAGLVEAAERLSEVGPLVQEHELARAVDVLGSAITVAGRRIDITASIVAGDTGSDVDDRLAWDAWERVTEPTAWVAASETGTHGAPGEVAYATDLRVIECSRDPRTREEIAQTGSTVGGTAWATALHAFGDEVWEQAWRAADRAARDIAGLTIRVEMGRIAKTALLRSPQADDAPEAALEIAEQAAREALVRAALRGGELDRDGEHPWDAARDAARSSAGGGAWSVVIDESRRAVGEEAWNQAMEEARAVVDDLLVVAPDTVGRVVAAAVAREACSAAARGVAYRAAAVARAHGADDIGAEQAANDALARTSIDLREAAFVLLEHLVAPPR
jgi:hypothetical protein